MRYGVALLVAVLVIAAGSLWAWLTIRQVEAQVRDSLRRQQEAGKLPPALQGVDVESVDIRQFAVQLPPEQEGRLALARALARLWYIWAPGVVLLSLAGAALVGRLWGRSGAGGHDG
jgi:hypothetical protein